MAELLGNYGLADGKQWMQNWEDEWRVRGAGEPGARGRAVQGPLQTTPTLPLLLPCAPLAADHDGRVF